MSAPAVFSQEAERQNEFGRDCREFPVIDVLGVRVDCLNMDALLAHLAGMLQHGEKGYLSAITVHGVMLARRDPAFSAALDDATVAIPDGTPIAWAGRLQGHSGMQYVTGPALMREVFLREEFVACTHFFYGGGAGVAQELAAHFRAVVPGAKIVGTYTPPYRPLTKAEERALIAQVRQCRPDMIWVGLGTPKQDKFMRRYLPLLDTKIMFGVGAAFDFHTGRIRDCSPWIKRAGLQWLHRLIQDPKRLWWRYLRDNPAFVWSMLTELAKRRSGRRSEPAPRSDSSARRRSSSKVAPCCDPDESATA